jgi:hypothetical protein
MRAKSEDTKSDKDKDSNNGSDKRVPHFARHNNLKSRKKESSTIFSFKVFDQDKSAEGGYDSAVDEDHQPYYI